MDAQQQIKDLELAFAKINKDFEEAKAYGDEDGKVCSMEDKMEHLVQAIGYALNNLSERISNLSNNFWDYTYQHSKGHVPPLKTATNLEKFLKSVGMDGDYDVVRPAIYVSASKRGNVVEATYNFKK